MIILRKHFWVILFLVSTFTLSGCGFHLRQGITLSDVIQPIYIDADSPNSTLVQLIKNQFDANNIALTSSKKAAKLILHISKVKSTTQLTSLRGGSEAGQYTVTTSITISASDAKGHPLMKANTIAQQHTYSSNATQTLSSNYTSNNITDDMQQSLTNQVLSQVAAIASHSSSKPTSLSKPTPQP